MGMTKTKGKKRSYATRTPYSKDRLISEMQIVGEFGLRNKKELRTFENTTRNVKKQASALLVVTDETKFTVEGRALLHKLKKQGVLVENVDYFDRDSITSNLEKILDLNVTDFLKRRLQHRVFETGMATSVHQARRFITYRYIQVGGSVVDKPNFIVHVDQNSAIQFSKRYESMRQRVAKKEEPA